MPIDEWAKARRSDVARKAKQKLSGTVKRRHRQALFRAVRDPNKIASRWSSNSCLWFGVHKNMPIKDVPLNYLKWLVDSHVPGRFWRMDGLVAFLKMYIAQVGKG